MPLRAITTKVAVDVELREDQRPVRQNLHVLRRPDLRHRTVAADFSKPWQGVKSSPLQVWAWSDYAAWRTGARWPQGGTAPALAMW